MKTFYKPMLPYINKGGLWVYYRTMTIAVVPNIYEILCLLSSRYGLEIGS